MRFKKKYPKTKGNNAIPPIQRRQFTAFENVQAAGNKALARTIANGDPENYNEG